MKEKKHIIHIRGLDDESYKLLWNMRKRYKARSWADLIKKLTEQMREEVEEYEWL